MLTCVRQRIALLFVPTDVQYLVTLRKIASSLNTQVSLKPELVSRWVSWSHWHSSIYGCPQQLLWPQYDWPYISWKLLTLAIQKSNRVDCKDHFVINVVNPDEPGIAWLSLCFILETSWVALFSVCEWVSECVRHRCHPTKSPLFPIYTGIQALCWPCTT